MATRSNTSGTTRQPFSRLSVPSSHGAMVPVVSDIYDKLSLLPQNLAAQFQLQLDAFKSQVQGASDAAKAAQEAVASIGSGGSGSGSTVVTGVPTIYSDSHAVRDINYPASAGPYASLYCENDRQTIYYTNTLQWVLIAGFGTGVLADRYNDLGTFDSGFFWITNTGIVYQWNGTDWIYIDGKEYMTLADFNLRVWTVSDNHYQIGITDYAHDIYLEWPDWKFDTGDPGSNYMVPSGDGSSPRGGVWQVCDGTTVDVFDVTGSPAVPTTFSVTTRDLTGDVLIRGVSSGAYTGTIDPGTHPIISGGTLTFSGTPAVLTGTNSAPTFTGAALGTHQHDAPVGDISATTAFLTGDFGTSAPTTHTRGVDFTVASSAGSAAVLKTSAVSAGTPTGSVSAPTLTMNSYTPAGTITGGGTVDILTVGHGMPKSIGLVWYLRR